MNFITFPVAATNAFPMANTTSGGQLATEFNLKSRESVNTDPEVTFSIGPSFVHSESDFEVGYLTDTGGVLVNSYTLTIAEGRGVINGHYIETLAPMTIDLVEANAELASNSQALLKGNLAVGIKTFFATEQTIAGAILAENDEDMFLGIQLVVLPADDMILPSETPNDQSKVTADIRLATFTFVNNTISNIKNCNDDKLKFMSASRLTDLEKLTSDEYVSKKGLNSKKLYAFAGKGVDPSTGLDTWEDITDSTIIWDAAPTRTSDEPAYTQAQIITTDQQAFAILPHKQVLGMTDDDGNAEYYEPRVISLPIADYTDNTVGFVSKEYTRQIKSLATTVSQMRSFPNGKQLYVMEQRDVDEELPSINSSWNYGDYILVNEDYDYLGEVSDTQSAPSTMYVVMPGLVTGVQYITKLDGDAETEPDLPSNLTGLELGYQQWYESTGAEEPGTISPEYYPELYSSDDEIRGIAGDSGTDEWVDYFRVRYYKADSATYEFTDYYYAVSETGSKAWSSALILTGSIGLATEDSIGGFLNTAEEATDYGYVRLDDTGHLKLVDYELLRSGTLAYQIATDLTIEGDDTSEIQVFLNEYVNDRVAFPSSAEHGAYSSVLNLYLNLTADMSGTIEICGIDSRFNTAVNLHIQGEGTSNVIINITDCEKFMIDPSINGTPVINIFRTCLRYDPIVFHYIKACERSTSLYGTYTGFRDLTIWYEMIESDDPTLVINGMTVSEIDSPVITSTIDYWQETGSAVNDNHYLIALKSITFSGTGDIVSCQICVANNSTDNIIQGDKIAVGRFILPQGENLIYPQACLSKTIKVSGSFTSAYYSGEYWYVTDNTFSIETGTYTAEDTETSMTGTMAFHSVTSLVDVDLSRTSISPWEPDSYHVFSGGAIS